MFDGMERVVEAPLTAGTDDKAMIKVDCEKNLSFTSRPLIFLYVEGNGSSQTLFHGGQ